MALVRILEPEVMDDPAEAIAYDAMDFLAVNQDFATLVSDHYPKDTATVLDLGTGTARMPILLVQKRPRWQVTAVDLAESMLAVGRQNVAAAGLTAQIELVCADAKQLTVGDRQFDVIMSNSLIHHLPDPLPCFQQMKRLVKPQGIIIVRDLFRPPSIAAIEAIIQEATGSEDFDPHQLKLFQDSLHAAFTVPEIQAIAAQAGLDNAHIYQSSSRHWTMIVQT